MPKVTLKMPQVKCSDYRGGGRGPERWSGLARVGENRWQSPYSILGHAMVYKISCKIFYQCVAVLCWSMSRWEAVSLWHQERGWDTRLMQTSDIISSSNIFEIVRHQAWPLTAQPGSRLGNDYCLKWLGFPQFCEGWSEKGGRSQSFMEALSFLIPDNLCRIQKGGVAFLCTHRHTHARVHTQAPSTWLPTHP